MPTDFVQLVFFATTLQSWGIKSHIYIEYRDKWSKLQLFQMKNGVF